MNYHLEAEYESGYVHSSEHQDVSPYMPCEKVGGLSTGPNIFSDIVHKRPEPFHGRLVRLSLVTPDETYDVDWAKLPDNARPIYLVDREMDTVGGVPVAHRVMRIQFGYQYNDPDGKNHKEIMEIT